MYAKLKSGIDDHCERIQSIFLQDFSPFTSEECPTLEWLINVISIDGKKK